MQELNQITLYTKEKENMMVQNLTLVALSMNLNGNTFLLPNIIMNITINQ